MLPFDRTDYQLSVGVCDGLLCLSVPQFHTLEGFENNLMLLSIGRYCRTQGSLRRLIVKFCGMEY